MTEREAIAAAITLHRATVGVGSPDERIELTAIAANLMIADAIQHLSDHLNTMSFHGPDFEAPYDNEVL